MNHALSILFLSLLIPLSLFSDLSRELDRYFEEIKSSTNVTSADVYEGQKAGYITGGGVSMRNRSMRLQPSTITLPHFDAGCGGIDIYTGALSFVNGEEIVDTLKSIGSSSMGYAFLLALETVSPQVANTMKQLQSWANTVNATNIGSCEVASQLVGSVWPKDSLASQHICKNISTHYGGLTDQVAARHQCTVDKGKNELKQARDKEPGLLLDSYNLAWEAIQKQGLIGQISDAAVLMTLMGTLVVKGDQVEVYPAKATERDYLEKMLDGGSVSVYTCDEKDRCLLIKEVNRDIDRASCWRGRITSLLNGMQEKVLDDVELNANEIDLLSKTHLPLYRIINVISAYRKGISPIELQQVADIVARDVLIEYLRDSLEIMRASCEQLKYRVAYADKIDNYLESLTHVERIISQHAFRSTQLMDQERHFLEKISLLEKHIAAELCL